MQTTIASHIIQSYQKHCAVTGKESLSCRSTFRILEKVVHARKSQTIAGLDNIAEDGLSAFAKMKNIVYKLKHAGINGNECKEVDCQIDACCRYLKSDYVSHIISDAENSCADHCRNFGLSDPSNDKLQLKCNHEHTFGCEECERIGDLFPNLRYLSHE